MSNHYHLIASTPDANISKCMERLNGVVSKRLNDAGNRINENFAGRHFKTILQCHNYYLCAYKYNYRNPVTAGICKRVENYKYSSLSGLLGINKLIFPLEEDTTLFFDPEGTINWLNRAPDEVKVEAVKNALMRPYFKSRKHRKDGKPIIDEDCEF